MTNRYVTDAEKAGLKRRMESYLDRMAEKGLKRRQLILTDAELKKVRAILSFWRGETLAQDGIFDPPANPLEEPKTNDESR